MNPADPLLRLVYTSRSLVPATQQFGELRAVAQVARTVNALRHVGGALLAANGHYLHLLEGPRSAVEALFETILLDARHTDVDLLKLEMAEQRDFPAMTFAMVERNEVAGDTTERVRELRAVPKARAADFLRLFSVPRVSRPSKERRDSTIAGVSGVVFASPGGLWAASVIGHMAAVAGDRVGRSTLTALGDDGEENRALVEYADLVVPGLGAVRGVSLARPHASASPLFERVALIVLIVTASDAGDAQAHLEDWARLPQVQHANPMVLVASSLSSERREELAQTLRSAVGLNVTTVAVKPHDAAAVWAAAQAELRALLPENTSTGFTPTTATSEFASTARHDLPAVYPMDELSTRGAALTGTGAPEAAAPSSEPADPMRRLRQLPGFGGACRFRTEPMALLELHGAAAESRHLALARWVAAQQALAGQLGSADVEDLVLTAGGETTVCRRLADGSWIDVIVPADQVPLAAARAALAAVAKAY